uniref:PX domain-containing protein n=1 Tax=Neogobius melanostomus TaxID=47308 RepID=A0A8C6S3E9_9GOBI
VSAVNNKVNRRHVSRVNKVNRLQCSRVNNKVNRRQCSADVFVRRGQGKDEHFEVKVSLLTVMGESWSVFRRYSHFREMHHSLRLKFPRSETHTLKTQHTVACLEFPPKKLFRNKDEKMVSERRPKRFRIHSEIICTLSEVKFFFFSTTSEQTSRLRISPFFKKGVFESSSHGTG